MHNKKFKTMVKIITVKREYLTRKSFKDVMIDFISNKNTMTIDYVPFKKLGKVLINKQHIVSIEEMP